MEKNFQGHSDEGQGWNSEQASRYGVVYLLLFNKCLLSMVLTTELGTLDMALSTDFDIISSFHLAHFIPDTRPCYVPSSAKWTGY